MFLLTCFSQVTCDAEYLVEQKEGEGAGLTVDVFHPQPKLHKYKYTKPELKTEFTVGC